MSAVERLTASQAALVPSVWRYLFALLVWLGNKLFKAAAAVEAPVPPSATAKSVMPVIEPPVIVAFDEDKVVNAPAAGVVPPIAVLLMLPPVITAEIAPVKADVPVTAKLPPTVKLSPAVPTWKSFNCAIN